MNIDNLEVGIQKSEAESQKLEVKCRKLEDVNGKLEKGSRKRKSAIKTRNSEMRHKKSQVGNVFLFHSLFLLVTSDCLFPSSSFDFQLPTSLLQTTSPLQRHF